MPTYFVRVCYACLRKAPNPNDSIRIVEAKDIWEAQEIGAELLGVDVHEITSWSHPEGVHDDLEVRADGMICWKSNRSVFFPQASDLIGS